jgi:hypothetical protein
LLPQTNGAFTLAGYGRAREFNQAGPMTAFVIAEVKVTR